MQFFFPGPHLPFLITRNFFACHENFSLQMALVSRFFKVIEINGREAKMGYGMSFHFQSAVFFPMCFHFQNLVQFFSGPSPSFLITRNFFACHENFSLQMALVSRFFKVVEIKGREVKTAPKFFRNVCLYNFYA